MSRRGLTLIEVLVVLFVLVLLIGLLLPAMQSARGPARRSLCLHNIKNVSLAAYNFASQSDGRFPALEDGEHGWPVRLFMTLDQPTLARQVAAGETFGDNAPSLSVLECPDDADSINAPGGLSYVANAGFGRFRFDVKANEAVELGTHSLSQDWNGDGTVSKDDKLVARATGVLWRPDGDVQPLTLDENDQADGQTTTLLFAESLHAGPWTARTTASLGFVIAREGLMTDPARGPLAVTRAALGPFAPNSGAVAPAPSSNHAGQFDVAFCDGRAQGLSTDIDPVVYVRLMTSAGSRYGETRLRDDGF